MAVMTTMITEKPARMGWVMNPMTSWYCVTVFRARGSFGSSYQTPALICRHSHSVSA